MWSKGIGVSANNCSNIMAISLAFSVFFILE
jgi:hypothetical protein